MSAPTVLIVEDEEKLASLLSDYLARDGINSHCVLDGNEVMPWFRQHPCDLILLDIMLPNRDGISLCKEIRASSDVPIIMCTARVEEIDRLLGLELGADDYICKPFSPREVVARVKAVLRRWQKTTATNGDSATSAARSPITVDQDRYKARIDHNEVDLTAIEFKMLAAMVADPGRIFSRDQLMDLAYRDHRIVSDRTIDSHIKKLRRKIRTAADGREYIHSVYGVGYKFEPGDGIP
ncbi:MAG: response regulator [Ketobacteraceae bacterium]|nr:response regulator [Ketobacteraceae bacterium]